MTRELAALRAFSLRDERAAADALADYAHGASSLGPATAALDALAAHRSVTGCIDVLSGHPRGFVEVDRACLYRFWDIRLLLAVFDRNPHPGKQGQALMDTIAICWMHAEAIGATHLREQLDHLVTRVVDGYPGVVGRNMNPLCTLVAHLVTGRPVDELEALRWAPIGVYTPIAAGTLRSSDYDALATYHQHALDGRGYPPFRTYPYRVIPFELVAIARRTGIRIDSRHPLLTSSLARRRDVPDIAMPDELEPVIERATCELALTTDGLR